MQSTCIEALRADNMHGSEVVNTTLYDLLQAIQDELRPGEEHLAAHIVAHIIRQGRIRLG